MLCSAASASTIVHDIEIHIKDHHFEPSEIKVSTGEKIRLHIHNLDNSVEEFESHDLNREKIVPALGSIVVVLAPLNPGEYKFFGDFHQTTANGKLIVE
jgi:plastocyanin